MTVKLFVLGLPGSGKSTVARYITTYTKGKAWEATRINDYIILQNMFLADAERKQFKPTEYGGFDVLDHSVFVEFARNDYLRAFQQFSDTFLQAAYFLYLNVDTETCKRRIHERITHPSTMDDFYVSEYIFDAYYHKDNGHSIPQILEGDYGIDKQRVAVIDNNRSLQTSSAQINRFVDTIIKLEVHHLRQTEPIQIISSFISDNELAK